MAPRRVRASAPGHIIRRNSYEFVCGVAVFSLGPIDGNCSSRFQIATICADPDDGKQYRSSPPQWQGRAVLERAPCDLHPHQDQEARRAPELVGVRDLEIALEVLTIALRDFRRVEALA